MRPAAQPGLTPRAVQAGLMARRAKDGGVAVWTIVDHADLDFKKTLHTREQDQSDVSPVGTNCASGIRTRLTRTA